ncbi:hypothetical protein DV515_00017890 [Chloebia gouldiae]|uniref:Uncharacterized protein n=2 Tax=Chloebia gouldiae TaxID=44316 RepID=A0A3L8Q900_CHLGU|nr:hypothetical protein DV515_00017890 [Chloebia gouldiae]
MSMPTTISCFWSRKKAGKKVGFRDNVHAHDHQTREQRWDLGKMEQEKAAGKKVGFRDNVHGHHHQLLLEQEKRWDLRKMSMATTISCFWSRKKEVGIRDNVYAHHHQLLLETGEVGFRENIHVRNHQLLLEQETGVGFRENGAGKGRWDLGTMSMATTISCFWSRKKDKGTEVGFRENVHGHHHQKREQSRKRQVGFRDNVHGHHHQLLLEQEKRWDLGTMSMATTIRQGNRAASGAGKKVGFRDNVHGHDHQLLLEQEKRWDLGKMSMATTISCFWSRKKVASGAGKKVGFRDNVHGHHHQLLLEQETEWDLGIMEQEKAGAKTSRVGFRDQSDTSRLGSLQLQGTHEQPGEANPDSPAGSSVLCSQLPNSSTTAQPLQSFQAHPRPPPGLAVHLQQNLLHHAPDLARMAREGLGVDDLCRGKTQGKGSPGMGVPAHLGGHGGLHAAKLLDGPVDVVPAARDDAQEQLHLHRVEAKVTNHPHAPVPHPHLHPHSTAALSSSLPWHSLRPLPLLLSFVPNPT